MAALGSAPRSELMKTSSRTTTGPLQVRQAACCARNRTGSRRTEKLVQPAERGGSPRAGNEAPAAHPRTERCGRAAQGPLLSCFTQYNLPA